MKKYIPVFGPQELFDGAQEDAIAVRVNDYKKITYYHHNEEDLKSKSMQDLHAIPIVAMRRIEETPVWTVADQKAGRLPEVGAEVLLSGDLHTVEAVNEGEGQLCLRDKKDGELSISYVQYIAPVETPAEKAAQLKDEWCKIAAKKLKNLEYTSPLASIYDAMLSGELKAPESTE